MSDIVVPKTEQATLLDQVRRQLDPGDPVLSWMIFASLNVLSFVLLWFYGLLQTALDADPTHITLCIAVIYIATSFHCLWRCMVVSRETAAERRLAAWLVAGECNLQRLDEGVGNDAGDGLVGDHVRDLITKSRLLAEDQKLDQTLLLRVLAQKLNGSTPFGAFAADLVMKLGLFGTIVGFIMMLAPIAGLNADDQAAIKSSMSLMSEGMAVAMYTTLSGLVGSILIKIEYQFVETATAALLASAVSLTEVHVVPVLERGKGAA